MHFNDPGTGGDRIDWSALDGALLLFEVKAVEEGIVTAFGDRSAVRADITTLDGEHKGETYHDALVFPLKLIGQLKGSVGEMVLGRLGKGTAKAGQNPPWQLAAASDADRQIGERYLAYAAQQRIEEEAPF